MSKFIKRPRINAYKTTAPNIKNLFELIREEKMVIEHIAVAWIQQYQQNDTEAYLILVHFLLESIGLDRSIVSLHDLESQEIDTLLMKIYRKVKDSEDYPLTSKSKTHKAFYLNFQHFWIYLTSEAGDALYDGSMLTFITNWLASLSFSKYRCVRHTCTLAILSLSQALIDIFDKETSDWERVQTFIRTEIQNSDTQRLQHLKQQETEIQEKLEIINNELELIYKEVISERSLDILMEIRAICIQGLHYMTEKFPEKFISLGALDILSTSIYDKTPEVRLKCLEFINTILTEENVPQLQLFINRQKLRLVEMSHDVDNKCSVSAINLCTRLAKLFDLNNDEKQIISCLAWADNEEIRSSACNFLLQVVFKDKLPVEQALNRSLTLDHGRQFDSEKSIMKIVKFHKDFNETDIHRLEIVVQTLWNKTSAVKSWDAMCELLRRGERSNTTSLSDIDKQIIIRILISGLKFICSSPDRKQKHVMVSLTSTLIQQLPALLVFYGMDPETLREIVKLPMYLDLSALSSKDLKEPFHKLVAILMELYHKSDNFDIISRATQSLAKLAREPHALQKDAKHEFVKLVNEICNNLKAGLIQFSLEHEEKDLEKWLVRGESVLMVYDIIDEIGSESFAYIIGILTQYLSNSISNSKLASSSAGIMYFYHLWDLNRITKVPEGLENYIETRNAILENFAAIVAKPDCDCELKFKVFKLLCETLMVVSSQAAFGSPLHYGVSTDMWTTIEEYMLGKAICKTQPNSTIPSNAFYKFGAVDEPFKDDADEASQTICLLVARIISFCPSLTTSHLPSSFFAHFGTSNLKSISLIVKQVILHYKTKESQQSGVFNDNSLFFSIILESLIKCLGTSSEEDIFSMKDLAKKFTVAIGNGAMRPRQADKFLSFILDGISFGFSHKDNFSILEGLTVFLTKGYLSPTQMKELYDRVLKDADTIENKIKEHEKDITAIMYPIKQFLYSVGKVVGIARQPPVLPSEKTKKQINKKREELYRKKDGINESKQIEAEKQLNTIKKSSFDLVEEFKNSIKKSAANEFDDEVYVPRLESDEDEKNNEDEIQNLEIPMKRLRDSQKNIELVRVIKKSAISDLESSVENKKFASTMSLFDEIKNKTKRESIACGPSIKKNSLNVGEIENDKPIIKKSSISFQSIPESEHSDKNFQLSDQDSDEDNEKYKKRPIKTLFSQKY